MSNLVVVSEPAVANSSVVQPRQPVRIAVSPAHLQPYAETIVISGGTTPPVGAEIMGYALAGLYGVCVWRIPQGQTHAGCYHVEVVHAREAHDARLCRDLVNMSCAQDYIGHVALLADYRSARRRVLLSLKKLRANAIDDVDEHEIRIIRQGLPIIRRRFALAIESFNYVEWPDYLLNRLIGVTPSADDEEPGDALFRQRWAAPVVTEIVA